MKRPTRTRTRARVCSSGCSSSGLDTRRASVLQRWPWLVLSLCVVVPIYTLRSPTAADTTRSAQTRRSAHTGAKCSRSSCRAQREQLLSLQSRLPAAEVAPLGGCVDSWAVQYPLELEMWMATAAHGRRSGDAMSLPSIARRRAAFARVRRLAIVVGEQPLRRWASSASWRHSRKSSPNPRRRTIPTW